MARTDDERHGADGAATDRYDRTTMEPSSQVVVSAVAESLDCSPLDLEPLYHRVDPESLDSLVDRSLGEAVSTPAGDPSVEFRFAGCEVAVTPVEVRVVHDRAEPNGAGARS